MASLLAAAIFFVRIHFVISGSPLRGKIVASLGDGPFRGLFSLLSLIEIVWLSRAYSQAEYIQLWRKLYGFRPVCLGSGVAGVSLRGTRVRLTKPDCCRR